MTAPAGLGLALAPAADLASVSLGDPVPDAVRPVPGAGSGRRTGGDASRFALADREAAAAWRADGQAVADAAPSSGRPGAPTAENASRPLAIGGLSKLSTCDWPGKLAATVFLQGCPWNCLYCHNPDLIDPRAPGSLDWADVLAFLRGRVGLLDAVVFSGGEATRQELGPAIAQVRELGFLVGLHTSGAYPRRLAALLDKVDWVGFDVKALPDNLPQVTGVAASAAAMAESLRLLLASGVDCQVRTTWGPGVPTVATPAQAEAVLDWARAQGVSAPVLQPVRAEGARPAFRSARAAAIS
ncbi:MAG: anaerobic ribonucleoside-triphosphate reductase activating protein [Bifidobacteriaceae bacterium]|jgi:pyruvate formate lyase activating enzyme|nr:anaerobic ribonucleoside-triphosphate reductase activating protein [Bifidobacteriaceae bacterium]